MRRSRREAPSRPLWPKAPRSWCSPPLEERAGRSSPPNSGTSRAIASALPGSGSRRSPRRCARSEPPPTPSSAGPPAPSRTRAWSGVRTGMPGPRRPCAVTPAALPMRAPGVFTHAFLGGTTRAFEVSGMEWGPDGHARPASSMPDDALCAAVVTTVARHIAAVIDVLAPHAVITYAANGGYGHPDHVRVHEATMAAIDLAEWRTGRLLCVDTPTEVAQRAFDPGQAGFAETGFAPVEAIPAKPPVDRIVISQDVTAVLAAKRAALEAHRTQVSVSGAFFALSNGVGQRIGDHEYYSIGAGVEVPEDR